MQHSQVSDQFTTYKQESQEQLVHATRNIEQARVELEDWKQQASLALAVVRAHLRFFSHQQAQHRTNTVAMFIWFTGKSPDNCVHQKRVVQSVRCMSSCCVSLHQLHPCLPVQVPASGMELAQKEQVIQDQQQTIENLYSILQVRGVAVHHVLA